VGSSQVLLGPEKMEPAGMVRGSGSGSGRSVHLAGLRSGVLRNDRALQTGPTRASRRIRSVRRHPFAEAIL
jgi:hypothetical protein